MEEGDKFVLAMARLAIISLCTILTIIAVCTSYQSYLVTSAIKQGADPIKAACAINGIDRDNAVICSKL